MKVFIGLALLSVAFAGPVIQPVTLPKAPLPAIESDLELPQPEKPVVVNAPTFQIPDISPAIIPQEIIDALENPEVPADVPVHPVQIVDISEIVADAVKVVEVAPKAAVAEEESPAEDDGLKVKFVEEAFNNNPEVAENAEAENFVAEIAADAVRVIDVAPQGAVADVAADAVKVVDVAPQSEDTEVVANAVRVVDVAPQGVVAADSPVEDDGLKVKFVDVAFNNNPEVAENAPINADSVILVPHFNILPAADIVADHVHIVDAPIVVDLGDIVDQVISAQMDANAFPVRFEDGPARPAYYHRPSYYNPMLR